MLVGSCEGNQLERSCLNHKHFLEFWEVFCDAELPGDLGTRKSRSGMAVMWDIKHGSAVQSLIPMSSGESEDCALLRSPAHALGINAMLNDSHALRQQRVKREG